MIEHEFETRDAASIAAADRILAALRRRLTADAKTSLVVSGGTSPRRCLRELAVADIAWSNVHLVLSDERWVPPDSSDSNERFVRETLLQNAAKGARLQGVYREGLSVEKRAVELDGELRLQPLPFACSLLGMGADGHFASLFPDAENLADGVDMGLPAMCIPVRTAASPYARISLTLSALSRSDEIVLLLFGHEKWAVLQAAKRSADAFPVSRLLLQKRAPVHVYWAP
ncbi:MAG: 6-phosphogluconolactonase [Halioglobus sp.]|nr:6-phosphogluconolactonase [Halioglobus sp.]